MLKAGTIAENIAYGKPDATREEIIAAAKKRAPTALSAACRTDTTHRLPRTAQYQPGAAAAALYCAGHAAASADSDLDEATSSIDTRTEVLVQDAFEELMKGRTSFIVAHRLSTIKNADQILVMKAGNIIERGTHDELLAQGDFYKQLYESQFAKA